MHKNAQKYLPMFSKKLPCITGVQYHEGAVPWGVQYRGGYHEACGGYLEYCGDVQYCGGYHDKCGCLEYCGDVQYCGGYHEYDGVILSTAQILSTMGDIMSTVGDTILCNLSTMGDIMIHVGNIMSIVGFSVPWGYSNNKRFPPQY